VSESHFEGHCFSPVIIQLPSILTMMVMIQAFLHNANKHITHVYLWSHSLTQCWL